MPAPPPESEPAMVERDRRHHRPRCAKRAVDDAAQIARSRPRIVLARERRDHRDAVGTRRDRLAGIAGVRCRQWRTAEI